MQQLTVFVLLAGLAVVAADHYCTRIAGRPTCLWCAHGACFGKRTWYEKSWCYDHCPEPEEPVDKSPGGQKAAQLIGSSIDESVDPCNDFFRFACGNWVKEHKATEDKPVRRALDDMQTVLTENLMQVMEMLSSHEHHGSPNSWLNKAIDFYSTCKRDGDGHSYNIQDVIAIMDEFGGWPLINRSSELPADLNYGGLAGLVYHDTMTTTAFSDPYVTTKPTGVTIGRKKIAVMTPDEVMTYKANMEKAATKLALELKVILNKTELQKGINDIADFQQALAAIKFTYKFERHPLKTFGQGYSHVGIQNYLRRLMTPEIYDALPDNMNLSTNALTEKDLAAIEQLLANSDATLVRNWQIGTFIMLYFERLGFHASFGLPSSLHRFRAPQPLNLTCTETLLNRLDLATGRINAEYIEPETLKLNAATIGSYILEAYHDNMAHVDWLDDESKQNVFNKLAGFQVSYGWPDWIMDDFALDDWYSDVQIYPNISFAGLVNQFAIAQNDRQFRFLVQPPYTQLELFPSPLDIVNAEYVPEQNHLYILAGILQPPYYENDFPMVNNFGGVGVVIGHEMGHGYDRNGVEFDYKGRQKQILSSSVYDVFFKRTDCLAHQYSSYCLYPGICENGDVSVTENEADTIGVRMAFQGYRKWRSTQGKGVRLPGLEKYSSDQLFFMNYGRALCADYTKEVAPEYVDQVHSADPLRVLGATRNMPEFAEAFNCPSSSYMNPSQRCRIWTSDAL